MMMLILLILAPFVKKRRKGFQYFCCIYFVVVFFVDDTENVVDVVCFFFLGFIKNQKNNNFKKMKKVKRWFVDMSKKGPLYSTFIGMIRLILQILIQCNVLDSKDWFSKPRGVTLSFPAESETAKIDRFEMDGGKEKGKVLRSMDVSCSNQNVIRENMERHLLWMQYEVYSSDLEREGRNESSNQ